MAKSNGIMDNYYTVDIRSDTLSTPTLEMRTAMSNAIVGDDVYGEDQTVNELEIKSAKLFDKEAGLFVPSGTMANLLAIMVHCSRRGEEAIVGDLSHTFLYEQGGAAQIAGVQLTTIRNKPDGTFCLEELKRKIRGCDLHEPVTKLIIVENTHNMCGGRVIPLKWIEYAAQICRDYSLLMHMDGARVFNAAEVLKVPVARIAKHFDSISYCLSKGLSAPVGSILVGSKVFIKEARRLRKALGGGMRQAGILAAAGLIALDTIVPKLYEDHLKLRKLAEAINEINSPNLSVDLTNVETNILLIKIQNDKFTSEDLVNRLATVTQNEINSKITDPSGRGIHVKVSYRDSKILRMVTFHQVSDIDIDLAIRKIRYVAKELDEKYR